jgi:mono/diheme cytochrome c family protein
VRRMVATQSSDNNIAFYVCNNPGPEGRSQREVDELLSLALGGEREVACVAMEWSVSPGVNGGKPFTKFLTFGPTGTLLPSINLDGRGEKYMPGACVACHGGSKYNGRFPDGKARLDGAPDPSPDLGSRFLPFDLSNFLFGSAPALTQAAQNDALWQLNDLVKATEQHYTSNDSATRTLVEGWYPSGSRNFNTQYVGSAWTGNDDERTFYREVIGAACRTCHTALGSAFNWDAVKLSPSALVKSHVCGGGADIALNASMPNALITRDRITERAQADNRLAQLMTTYLGCSTPEQDPAFAKR